MKLPDIFCHWRNAANATKNGPISAGYDPKDLEPHIFVRGKVSRSVDQLVKEVGYEEAWKFLKQTGAAYGVNSDKAIKFLEKNG